MSNGNNRKQEDDEKKIQARLRAAKFLVKVKRLPPEDRFTIERFLDKGQFEMAIQYYRRVLSHSLRSVPSTQAVSATLTTTGAQSLQPYNVPQQVIARIAQEQAQQIMEKNIIPLIEETAKTTVQEHEKQERARENTLIEKAKRGGNEIFWIIVAFVLGSMLTIVLSSLGIHFP